MARQTPQRIDQLKNLKNGIKKIQTHDSRYTLENR